MGSFVDLELYHFLVGVDEMLVIVFVLEPEFERIFLDVASTLKFILDLMEQQSYLFEIGPEVGLDFGKDQHPIDFDLEGAMSGKSNKLLLAFIVISLYFMSVNRAPAPVFGEIFGRLILRDGDILEDSLGLCGYLDEELLVFFLVVPGAPVMEVAIDAVFHLDIHQF